jgi:hypothetical protein
MRKLVIASALLTCAACQQQPYAATTVAPAPMAPGLAAQDPSGQTPLPGQAPPPAPAVPPPCQDYDVSVTIAGKPTKAHDHACQQPDGSWQITQTTPGLPDQVFNVPPPPANAPPPPGTGTAAPPPAASGYYYPYPYPYPYPYSYYWADPWAYGLFFAGGSFIFVDRFHHFHHNHNAFVHAGMHNGFAGRGAAMGHGGHGGGHGGGGHGGGGHR